VAFFSKGTAYTNNFYFLCSLLVLVKKPSFITQQPGKFFPLNLNFAGSDSSSRAAVE
jgi:hypothetical protein